MTCCRNYFSNEIAARLFVARPYAEPRITTHQTHPAVAAVSSTVDHVVPAAAGRQWLAESNLVTACWPCNARKADLTLEQLRWQLRPRQESAWDGLAGSYRQLWEIARKPTNEAHPLWRRALGETALT